MMTTRLRFSHHTFSLDLMPRQMTQQDTGWDYLTQLRNVSEPDPNGFVDDFYISQAIDESDRI